jgi:transcriptional regulator with XRE-family HTH domain
MMHEKLISLRKERGFSKEEFSNSLAMEQTTYSRKERGKSAFTTEDWKKITEILGVQIEDIKEVKAATYNHENFTLNDNSIGVQHITVHQELLESVIRYNKFLEAEVERLSKTD